MSKKSVVKVDACFSPHLYSLYKEEENIVVIIDIFRATTAICTAFHHGAKEIIPIATIEEARSYLQKGILVGAERDAIKVDGFDFGNSPYDYMGDHVFGKTIALTTTNGTQAIEVSKNAYKVVIGAFTNISVLCDWLVTQNKNILLLCSGWKNRFNLEDSLFAGAMTFELLKRNPDLKLGDAALALDYLYQLACKNPIKFLSRASHKERLHKLNLKDDIRYCLQKDLTNCIPVLEKGILVNMNY